MEQTREFRTDAHTCGPLTYDSNVGKGEATPEPQLENSVIQREKKCIWMSISHHIQK